MKAFGAHPGINRPLDLDRLNHIVERWILAPLVAASLTAMLILLLSLEASTAT